MNKKVPATPAFVSIKKLMSAPIGSLTGRQLAFQLNMKLSTTYRWLNRGWIKANRLPNGRYNITPEEMQRVAKLRQGGKDTPLVDQE